MQKILSKEKEIWKKKTNPDCSKKIYDLQKKTSKKENKQEKNKKQKKEQATKTSIK